MRVFLTGATGFIGSAIVRELLDAGHEVLGLARSDDGAAELETAGAAVHRGSLEDLDTLRAGAAQSDGVIHTAYIHDFSRMAHAAEVELRAVDALGSALEGTGKPFVLTTGTALVSPGRVATEEDRPDPVTIRHPRAAVELAAFAFVPHDVRVAVVRPAPSVHGRGDHGFVPFLINIARAKGVSGYIGDGSNRWPGVHRLDASRLYRLALEKAPAGSVLHAIGEEGVPTRELAEVIGRHLNIPVVSIAGEDAADHFEWMAAFWGLDIPASNAITRELVGWNPVQPGLIADLDEGHYFEEVPAAA
jgi:nucleoside-diphosphate-sugar epimerase